MWFVTDFAGEIRAWNDRRARTGAGPKVSTAQAEEALHELLTDHLATDRPLPGRGGVLNDFFLATTIGST